jgi:hypothetical protein
LVADTSTRGHYRCIMASVVSFGDTNAGFQAGVVNGPVNTTFHLPPGELQTAQARKGQERRETPLLPDIVIPFPHHADFVERGTTLDRVEQICAVPD